MEKTIGFCAIGMAAALMVVGVESGGILRHSIQTAPVWVAAVLALAGSRYAGWSALGPFVLWLLLMINIWFTLLVLPHFLSGHFTPLEIAMTIVVGACATLGIIAIARSWRGGFAGVAILVLFSAAACGAVYLSLQPHFSTDNNFSAWISHKA